MNSLLKMWNNYEHPSNIEYSEVCDVVNVIKTVFQANNEIVSIFNEIFGWHFLLMIFKNIALALIILDGFTTKELNYTNNLQLALGLHLLLHVVSINFWKSV